jgi:hypothetical protein
VSATVHGWYTTGDDRRPPIPLEVPSNAPLEGNSDKLPIPVEGASWYTVPFVAEWFLGLPSIGTPAVGTANYANPSGTYGGGASAGLTVTPSVSVGAGVAYVGASDAPGRWGDWLVELDAGVFYNVNANLSIQLLGGYIVPDQGDHAYGLAFRTRFVF